LEQRRQDNLIHIPLATIEIVTSNDDLSKTMMPLQQRRQNN